MIEKKKRLSHFRILRTTRLRVHESLLNHAHFRKRTRFIDHMHKNKLVHAHLSTQPWKEEESTNHSPTHLLTKPCKDVEGSNPMYPLSMQACMNIENGRSTLSFSFQPCRSIGNPKITLHPIQLKVSPDQPRFTHALLADLPCVCTTFLERANHASYPVRSIHANSLFGPNCTTHFIHP